MAEEEKFSQIPEVEPSELNDMLELLDKLKDPPGLMIYGPPGIGKTTIVKEFAKKMNYELRVKHLSRMDATDWSGIPKIDANQEYTEFLPISLFKKSEKKIVIFFDELNTALPQVLNAALDVLLEKKSDASNSELPKNTIIVAAGNLGKEDGTYVEEFSSAVKTRLIQVKLNNTGEEWMEWARKNNIHKDILKFMEKENCKYLLDLSGFTENLDQIATPRGWERVSDFIKQLFEDNSISLEKTRECELLKILMTGTIGKKVTDIFWEFLTKRENSYKEKMVEYGEWLKKLGNAKRYYTGNPADQLPEYLEELLLLLNEGLKENYKDIDKEVKEFAEKIKTKEIDIKKALKTFLSTIDIKDLKEYLEKNDKDAYKILIEVN
jgi:Cdc6-like AAA superfamily ATPase